MSPSLPLSLPLPTHSSRLGARSRWATAWTMLAAATTLTLASCGGGGGGGGGSSTDSSTYTPSVIGPGAGFPLGVSVDSPTATGGNSLAVLGSSSVLAAVTTGSRGLDSSLVDASTLFNPAYLQHAGCYGPAVAYANHDDDINALSGTLASGDVAMWSDTDSATGKACSVAELDAQLKPLTAQTRQALLLSAALRRLVDSTGSGNLPDPGTTRDLTASLASQLSSVLSGVTVQSATVSAASDATTYSFRIVLRRGSGASAEALEITLQHTPNDSNERFAGVLQLTHTHLSNDASYGCADTKDTSTGLYRVAHVASLGYNRYDNALTTRLRSAQFCGAPSNGSLGYFGDLATVTESGEMDPSVHLSSSGLRNGTKGWRRELVRYSADVNLGSALTDHLQAWQNTPQDGYARVFLAHTESVGGVLAAQVFHAYGADLSSSDGSLIGFFCNWAGPGASHTTATQAFQAQSLSLNGNAWTATYSKIHYAPTNACTASTTMRFDANGDTVLGATEGSNALNQLDAPTGGRPDAQSEAEARGYWPPTLF